MSTTALSKDEQKKECVKFLAFSDRVDNICVGLSVVSILLFIIMFAQFIKEKKTGFIFLGAAIVTATIVWGIVKKYPTEHEKIKACKLLLDR